MFSLNKQSDYGMLILTHIASGPEKKVFCTSELASNTGLSKTMVAKILKLLVKASILSSTMGSQGGYHLNKSAKDISLALVLDALNNPIQLTSCLNHKEDDCKVTQRCKTKPHWEKINQILKTAFTQVTLENMILPISSLTLFQSSHKKPLPTIRS